ncbi:MAG: hypothetical protein ACM30G_04975 [Micromonosporaceae bacterium]
MAAAVTHARSIALTGSDQAVRAAASVFRGYVVIETGGASAATVRIYDNASAASGTLIGAVNLAAGGSADVSGKDLWCENGIYVDVGGSGTVAGSVQVG